MITLLLVSGPGWAQDEEENGNDATHSDATLPPLSRMPEGTSPTTRDAPPADGVSEQATRAAAALHVEPAFAHGVQSGLDLVYDRRYEKAREHFSALELQYPDTAVRSLGDIVIWQSLMLENFDFRYDKQYWNASKQARVDLDKADGIAGNEGWEALVRATVLGIESIHTMRQESYLPALNLAFQAMNAIETCRKEAPDFVDLQLADGIYNYWRTVVTMQSKVLPDFGDHRVEGIEQMQRVERDGVFIAPLASLALSYTWLEQGEPERALEATEANRQRYPNNVINNLMAGTVLHQMRKFDQALVAYESVSAADPKNDRVHYWRGVTLAKMNRHDEARLELERYLQSAHLEKWQRSYGAYRLGQVYAKKEQYANAVRMYEEALSLDGNKSAKAARERLVQRKKQGQIDW